jgi:hypothetical protein
MLTVGQINAKISELRSKIAVTQGVVLYLKTHYMPSDGAPTPEMHFTRSDHGKVPPEHIEATIADFVDQLDTFKHELNELENTPIGQPAPAPEPAKLEPATPPAPPEEKPAVKANGNAAPTKTAAPRKEAPSAAQRSDRDQPAAQPQAPAGKPG